MRLVLFAFTLCIAYPLLAQTKIDGDKIESAIQKSGNWFLKDKDITSVSIGVFHAGQTATAHFGSIVKGGDQPPTDETLYEIASVTKTMAGYLLAKAVEEGKVSLDDELNKYLDPQLPNLAFEGTPITIRHLATHTAGLPVFLLKEMNDSFSPKDKEAPFKFVASEATYGKEQLFAELAKFKLTRKPGTKYAYSNTGAELIGYVLETVYQKSIESLLQTYLLEKCGMDNTAIALNERQQAQLIQGYWLDNDTPSPNFINNLWSTGSGVKSTLGDLMKYIEFQLSKDDPTLKLSHETLYDEGNGNHLAYLWNVSTDRYGRYYDHHGGTGGMQNWIFVFPKYQLGISILTNHSGLATPKRLSKAARMILKEVVLD